MMPTSLPELSVPEPPLAFWRDRASYDATLRQTLVEPLEAVRRELGRVPVEQQRSALRQLAWYFVVDSRERAPTVIVDEPLAETFHALVRRAMLGIDLDEVQALAAPGVTPEVLQALRSYLVGESVTSPVADRYDHDQDLVRITYFVHGEPPPERWRLDGEASPPAYAKYRALNFFRRRLARQRIAWLPAAGRKSLQIQVGAHADVSINLEQVRQTNLPGKASQQQPLPRGWAGWKVRILKALASLPPVRWRYGNAWVFVDRDVDADDSAEHLYRWVREHHPNIKAWYLLFPDSPDWDRLEAEGFRLMPPGFRRRLLALNCVHVISSHDGKEFGLDSARYGDCMKWRYTFLQHGVIMNDLSHWLDPRGFDRFITSSPAEHRSLVSDDSPYSYTDREVRRTGLPRHDRLLRIARGLSPHEVNRLVVMPTWRGSLIDDRSAATTHEERLAAFSCSEYVQRWRSLLSDPALRRMTAKAGLTLTFVPHANAEPYLAAFDLPPDVQVARLSSGVAQQIFARAAVFVTDYTSVAFDLAMLRRPIFYYQFDQEAFYSGGHNWRKGYFDHTRDGFGPVLPDEASMLAKLRAFFMGGRKVDPVYLSRMIAAMPDDDEEACRRTFDSILDLTRRVDGTAARRAPRA